MKKFTIALAITLAVAAPGLRAVLAAQSPVTRIAYDQCWGDAGSWDLVCYIRAVVDGYDTLIANGVGPKWSPDGSAIAFTGTSDPSFPYYVYYGWDADDILVLNLADGGITNLSNNPARDWGPVWSRDGGKIAFASTRDGAPELYVMNANGANPTRITQNVGFTGAFGWSPDDSRFTFASDRDGVPELYAINADGSNLTRLTNNVGFQGPFAWSPNGSRIAFDCLGDGGADICSINSDGTNFVRLTNDPARDSGAAFSPADGTIAFVTERFGQGPEIAVMTADGAVTRVAAGTGGAQPVWSPDGQRLTFVSTIASFYTGTCYPDPGAHNADDFCVPVYGIYQVNADGTGLTATASGGNPNWFTSLPGQPVAAYTYQCSGVTCDFDAAGSFDPDGTVASYLWQFGDGTSASGPVAHHAYGTGAQYGVSLTVTDADGATGVMRVSVLANTPPTASFTIACTGATCTFDATGSSDPDGSITNYTWDFGDGNWAGNWNGAGASVTHSYDTGTFSARLIVGDNGGATGTAVGTVTVGPVNAPPVASFTSACSGLTCSFNASASSDPDGTIASYAWTFGDATSGSGATVNRTYAAGGTYSVTLTVTDNAGATSQTVRTVTVNAPPIATFTSACSELTCSFNASGSSDPDGTIASYAWTFGDATSGSGATVNRTYAAGGTYSVTLTVTDNAGAASMQTRSVTVVPPDMHVGDLDRASTIQQAAWTATVTITIHTGSHGPIANAVVSGTWNGGGTGSCATNASGQCAISKTGIAKKTGSVNFTVTNLALGVFVYKPAGNHDPDGDSTGTTISVIKP